MRREPKDGRDTLVFKFTPDPRHNSTKPKDMLHNLGGEIWIDAQERIVTRLVGWPAVEKASDQNATGTSGETPPPAVYVEMLRLPTGVWLPHVSRINRSRLSKALRRDQL